MCIGSGSRLYQSVQWSVTAVNYGLISDVALDISTIQASLNAFSLKNQVSRPFTVSEKNLQQATYTLTLTLTNFLGLRSFRAIVVNIIGDRNIPTLAVIGPSYIQITASKVLNILSSVQLSSCSTATGGKVKYTWSVININSGFDSALASTNLDRRRFTLLAYSLLVDNTYLITIKVRRSFYLSYHVYHDYALCF
jgi:hypothetical protein